MGHYLFLYYKRAASGYCGALFDVTGTLIGITSSKIVADEYENMGFVIPSNTVVGVVNKIISKQNEPDRLVGNRDA